MITKAQIVDFINKQPTYRLVSMSQNSTAHPIGCVMVHYGKEILNIQGPAMVVTQPSKSIVVGAGRTYMTAGGYVVRMIDDNCRILRETSAGLNNLGENITEANARTRATNGWQYKRDGSIYLNDEWAPKMKIVKELPFSLPTLPSGYKWLGDFPQFRVPVKGEHFIRYNSKAGFGDVVKCDGNFQVPLGEENRRLIVVPTEQESVAKQQVFVGEGYRKLESDEYFTPGKSHECCRLSDIGTSQETWAKVMWSNQASKFPDFVFREKVATQQESVAVKPQPLSIEGMVEVSHLKDYIVQKDDKYIECGKVYSAGELAAGPYKVKWFGSTVRLFATKKNYGDYVSKNSPPITEGPVIGAGYRKIDPKVDTPKEGDQFWSQLRNQWMDRPTHYGAFNHTDTYRRLKSSDWADAALISGVASASPLNKVPVQVQENEMSSNSSSSTETVKFETAKKLAVGTAKLGGKMIWRTADYFVFAPIKKAASPFMWMVRYAVLGTMVGGGVYACTNPDDAKELLWKCIPKISITVDAPEVLG